MEEEVRQELKRRQESETKMESESKMINKKGLLVTGYVIPWWVVIVVVLLVLYVSYEHGYLNGLGLQHVGIPKKQNGGNYGLNFNDYQSGGFVETPTGVRELLNLTRK